MNRYEFVEIVKSNSNKRYYTNNLYPTIPASEADVYVIAVEGDRYDLLADSYYRDVTLWWIIPVANSLSCDSLYPTPGIQLRIPSNIENILQAYRIENTPL